MTGAIIILLVTISVGFFLWVGDRYWHRKHPTETKSASETPGTQEETNSELENPHGAICCGRHLVCEKSLSPLPGEKIEYYDDEELDRFAGRATEIYTQEETDEFREIMTTMSVAELPGWIRSLQLRNIPFPQDLRDELFILIND